MSAHLEPVVVLLGATATGKSELALQLARELPLEVINADALQVYRGFDVGTAKPTAEQRQQVRHHLVDILEPWERFSAGEFARLARAAMQEIAGRGHRALVVGGSGLYLRALLEGIALVPPGDPAVRRELEERCRVEGLPALHRELARVDPESARRLPVGDRQRILRALEVERTSGVPLSAFLQRQPFGDQRLPAFRLGLTLPRGILYDRISARVAQMMGHGWLDEVKMLLGRGLDPAFPAFQAIGYRQLVRHLQGRWSLAEAIEDIQRETRRFAKRQLTWFRREPGVVWFGAEERQLVPRILEHLERSGPGRAHA
jgi:tRNA dimethylallyltransferase